MPRRTAERRVARTLSHSGTLTSQQNIQRGRHMLCFLASLLNRLVDGHLALYRRLSGDTLDIEDEENYLFLLAQLESDELLV